MKNTRQTLGVVGLVLVIAATVAWYRLAPVQAPAGQPPRVTIDAAALEALRADFNRYANETRLIVLLAPT